MSLLYAISSSRWLKFALTHVHISIVWLLLRMYCDTCVGILQTSHYRANAGVIYHSCGVHDRLLFTKVVTMHRCIDASRYLGRRYAYCIAT